MQQSCNTLSTYNMLVRTQQWRDTVLRGQTQKVLYLLYYTFPFLHRYDKIHAHKKYAQLQISKNFNKEQQKKKLLSAKKSNFPS